MNSYFLDSKEILCFWLKRIPFFWIKKNSFFLNKKNSFFCWNKKNSFFLWNKKRILNFYLQEPIYLYLRYHTYYYSRVASANSIRGELYNGCRLFLLPKLANFLLIKNCLKYIGSTVAIQPKSPTWTPRA